MAFDGAKTCSPDGISYDTSMCMEMKRHDFKVVVPNQEEDFWCIHCPREKPLAPEYKRYQKIFLQEYGAELNPEV